MFFWQTATQQKPFETQQWNYTQTALDHYLNNKTNSLALEELNGGDSTILIAAPVATLFLYLWGHELTDYMRDRYGVENNNAYLALFSILSYPGLLLINYLHEIISSAFNKDPQYYHAALHDYIRDIKTHHQNVPTLLQPLLEQCAAHPETYPLTEQQAADFMKEIKGVANHTPALAHIFDHITTTLLIPQATTPTTNQTPQTLSSFVHALQLDTCQASQPEKTKWEYVLSQLNILKQPSLLQTWSNTIHQYQWPIIFGLGAPLGMLFNRIVRTHYAEQISPGISRYLSLLLGFSGATLLTKLFGTQETHDHDRLHDALEFIDNWDYHKAYTPRCLHGLFEKLHQLFIKHHQQLNFHELFIDELYKIIAEIWMYSVQQKKLPEQV
jgi:hypothetical protein